MVKYRVAIGPARLVRGDRELLGPPRFLHGRRRIFTGVQVPASGLTRSPVARRCMSDLYDFRFPRPDRAPFLGRGAPLLWRLPYTLLTEHTHNTRGMTWRGTWHGHRARTFGRGISAVVAGSDVQCGLDAGT